MSQNRKDGETDADILRVLKDSGYPLEQEIASILEKMGWKFTLNYAFTDVETNKSREIDVLADRGLWDERYHKILYENIMKEGKDIKSARAKAKSQITDEHIRLHVEVIIECKKVASPVVFFCRTKQPEDFLPMQTDEIVQYSGVKSAEMIAKSKAESLGFEKSIHFIKCDAMHLPIRSNVANSVVSLGLLTCHTDGCKQILGEISRILRHKGRFLLDVQNKYSFNLTYYLIDALTKGRLLKLGFSSMKDFRNYLTYGKVSWIYRDERNRPCMNIPFSTFSLREIRSMLSESNLVQNRMFGAHLFTLIVPLEYQEKKLPQKTSSALLFLGRIEKTLKSVLARFSSVIIVAGYEK